MVPFHQKLLNQIQMKREIYFSATWRLLKKNVQLIVLYSKVEEDAGFKFSTFLAQLKETIRSIDIPPNIATRKNTRGPFLFQCYRVVFNKETNCLEFPKREFVHALSRTPKWKEEEEAEYENTAVSLEEDEESNLTG